MSTIKVDNIRIASESVSRPATGVAAAWVNFNGTTVTAPNDMTGVRDSLNMTGVVDNGVGDYTANISSNMSDPNYSASFTTGQSTDVSITNRACCVSVMNASFVRGSVYTATGGARIDMSYNGFAIHGDLA